MSLTKTFQPSTAKKHPAAIILVPFLLNAVFAGLVIADPQSPSPQQAKEIQTLMCMTESCTDADASTPGCKQYTTPLNTCYNAKTLFPGDESWSDMDIYDEMVMLNIKRTFYQSKDGSCAGRGEEDGGAMNAQPVDGDDSFVLPLDACVGPFGPPRPWGKFSLLGGYADNEQEGEVLSME